MTCADREDAFPNEIDKVAIAMTPLAHDAGSIPALQQAYANGTLDPVALLEQCLSRCDAVEPQVQAWEVLDRDACLRQARDSAARLRSGQSLGPLDGIPVAIKDVIDVAGLPTKAGSRTREQQAPAAADADIVSALHAAGAVIMGKVHTTEFAYFDGPPPTRNPWDTARTPGGSSAGPAAAIAAGMALASIGTQTAGSVVRPAAYCGIAAFKPSTHTVSTYGVVPFAPSFDTVGWFAHRMDDVAAVARAIDPWRFRPQTAQSRLRIGIVRDALLDQAHENVLRNLSQLTEKLREAGHTVEDIASAQGLMRLNERHRTLLEYETSRVHRALLAAPAGQVTKSLLDTITRGADIGAEAYARARADIMRAQCEVWKDWGRYDAVIFPAAPAVAPIGMATGDPAFIVPFTALGGPIATIPTGIGEAGMPLGLMVTAAPGTDGALLQTALRVAEAIELDRTVSAPLAQGLV